MTTPATHEDAGAPASSPLPPVHRAPLGRGFRTLWSAAVFSNLADGVGRTAVPLIAITLSSDPLVISVLSALAFVPWLIFGLPAGMIVDRLDRRYVMALANVIRGSVALLLAILGASGSLSLWRCSSARWCSVWARRCSTTPRMRSSPAWSSVISSIARTGGSRLLR